MRAIEISNVIVGQNIELSVVLNELLEQYYNHKNNCDRIMLIIDKAEHGDYNFNLVLEIDNE